MKNTHQLDKFWEDHNRFTFTGFIQEKLLKAFIEKHHNNISSDSPLTISEVCSGRPLGTRNVTIMFETFRVIEKSFVIEFTGKAYLCQNQEIPIKGQFDIGMSRLPSGHFSISNEKDFEEFISAQESISQ